MPAGVRIPRFVRWRRHPVLAGAAALLLAAGLVLGGIRAYGVLFPPELACGKGMTAAGRGPALACVGVNLESTPFTKDEPARMRELEKTIRAANDAVRGESAAVVLMLNLSPVADVDTLTHESLYHNIEGAVTAVWRANNTAAYGSRPGIKLYLANMGSRYGSWRQAVDSVGKHAASERIAAVVGLGQSTEETRRAAAAISKELHIPVIGSTVTGNSMNLDPDDPAKPIPDMFRVAPTNTHAVIAANQYAGTLSQAVTSLAVIADGVAGDDYTATLAAEAKARFQAPGRTVTTLPYTSPRELAADSGRRNYLIDQFNLMHANLCQAAPSAVYFAGRGRDLGAFVQTWVQGAPCGIDKLRIIAGDDASQAIRDEAVLDGIKSGRVEVAYTALASPQQWGEDCPGTDAKRNFDQFRSAFTGSPDPCTKQAPGTGRSGADPLRFDPAHLASGQAMLTHDATAAAISAVRRAGEGVRNPGQLTGILHQFYCAQMLPGASGWLSFGDDGNPVGKPLPIVQINADGTTNTVSLTWPSSAPNLSLPQRGGTGAPGC
ncbi:hypothetical protein ACIQV2_13015 [Streptomyces globosus]|uniref:hypothetical protein n=1 Tax=Streptomyces globosus TaxID=68209 RepID=UPI0037F38E82